MAVCQHSEGGSVMAIMERTPLSSWGGTREGAGRKRKLPFPKRREIATKYFEKRSQIDPPRRDALIRKLMAEYKVTHRMVVRCVAEFLPDIRRNDKMFKYAIEGAEIQPLPAHNINKLKPGVYANKQLRLVVNSDGSRRWIYPFIWRFTVRHKVLGDSEMSLAMARELATEAKRRLAAGQNPIDGSWASAALQSENSKT
jgi:hypothetical protein